MRSRPHFTGVWLSDAEYGELLQLCRNSGLSASAVIRKRILSETVKPRPPECYAALLRELSAIGNNVNQIAHWTNAKGGAAQTEIHEAAALVKQAYRLILDTL